LRVAAAVPLPRPERLPQAAASGRPGTRRLAWFGGERHESEVFDAAWLAVGEEVVGPAFVESLTTTVVVYPGQRASTDDHGNVRLILAGTR
jgi:N-methylhydantoinase A